MCAASVLMQLALLVNEQYWFEAQLYACDFLLKTCINHDLPQQHLSMQHSQYP